MDLSISHFNQLLSGGEEIIQGEFIILSAATICLLQLDSPSFTESSTNDTGIFSTLKDAALQNAQQRKQPHLCNVVIIQRDKEGHAYRFGLGQIYVDAWNKSASAETLIDLY